jgi:5-formyltetrahydrofolate cyclo-ligase
MADQKKNLRRMLGECRASLAPEFAQSRCVAIQRRFIDAEWYRCCRRVVLYSPIQNEVATDLIAADALKSAKEVFFPRLDRARGMIAMARVSDPSNLVPGPFGIAQPPEGAPVAAPAELSGAVIAVPGLGFGPQGQRLGRGGGHYDRFLAALPHEAITVGLAYSFQLLDRVPEEPRDRRLQYIITESALLPAAGPSVRRGAARADRGGTPGWII